MIFNKESDFEEALIKILSEKDGKKKSLKTTLNRICFKTGQTFFLRTIEILTV